MKECGCVRLSLSVTWFLLLSCAGGCLPAGPDPGPSGGLEPVATISPPVYGPCLAVQQDLWEAESGFFDYLQRRHPGCPVGTVESSEEARQLLALGQSTLAVLSGEAPDPGAELLRAEPFVLVSHVASPLGEVTTAAAKEIFSEGGEFCPVVVGDGLVAMELLGLDRLGPQTLRVSSWVEAKELMTANKRLVALLPWELVDFKVRALAVYGQRAIADGISIGVYERRLWLAGDVQAWPRLSEDIREGLMYEVQPLVSLVAVGDVMLGRGIASLMAANSPSYPFLLSRELTRDADIAFGNLECAITSRGGPELRMALRGTPEAARALSEAGFDILSLANNHSGDYGVLGLLDTVHHLEAEGITGVGVSTEEQGHSGPVILARAGLKIGFLAFNHIGRQYVPEAGELSGPRWLEPEVAYEEVRRAADEADFVVVSLHWGREYVSIPDEFQQQVAGGMLEAGAGLVVGHHPHVVGAVAFEEGGLVAYSLGNYVFDQPFSVETMQGLALRALIDGNGLKQVEFVPVQIVAGQPVVLPRPEANAVLSSLFSTSEVLGGLPAGVVENMESSPTVQGLQVAWTARLPGQLRYLRVHDLDGDGIPEIVVGSGPPGGPNSVYVLDANGSLQWEYTLRDQINDMECGDLEGDGRVEVVLGTGLLDEAGEIVVLDAEGRLRWGFGVEAGVLDVAVGSVDRDAMAEVSAGEWGAFGDTIYLLDGEGHLRWKHPTRGSVHSVRIGDLEGDGRSEVLAGAEDVYALSGVGGLLWRYPTASYADHIALASLGAAPLKQAVAVTGYPDASVSVLDERGRLGWRYELDASPSAVLVEDTDGDGVQEVLVGALDGSLYLLGGDGALRWKQLLTGPVSDLALGDVRDDGIDEVVVGCGDYLYPGGIHVLDSLTGSVIASYVGLGQAALVEVAAMGSCGGEHIVAASGDQVYLLHWAKG